MNVFSRGDRPRPSSRTVWSLLADADVLEHAHALGTRVLEQEMIELRTRDLEAVFALAA
jgi:hypothetical protein